MEPLGAAVFPLARGPVRPLRCARLVGSHPYRRPARPRQSGLWLHVERVRRPRARQPQRAADAARPAQHRPEAGVATRGPVLMARRAPDLWVLGLFVLLPVLWLNQVLAPGVTGKTILPFDNLYTFEPWRSMRPDIVPYNPLVSDMVLES